ncbi:hypothetical protein [Caudoviricetes sp.]|nr:hypothetical protein [Caudoviricetes sp.]
MYCTHPVHSLVASWGFHLLRWLSLSVEPVITIIQIKTFVSILCMK